VAKKKKMKKIHAKFLIELIIPPELWNSLSPADKDWLKNMVRFRGWKAINGYHLVFDLENIKKLRLRFLKYGYVITYPKSAELRRFGLKYSGESLDIVSLGDAFEIKQYMPDGEVNTVIIPKWVVWRVYYAITRYMQDNKLTEIESPTAWEIVAKEFHLNQFFTPSGEFNKELFFGNRSQYFYFAYYPLKILDHIGKLEYSGKYIRLPVSGGAKK